MVSCITVSPQAGFHSGCILAFVALSIFLIDAALCAHPYSYVVAVSAYGVHYAAAGCADFWHVVLRAYLVLSLSAHVAVHGWLRAGQWLSWLFPVLVLHPCVAIPTVRCLRFKPQACP